MSHTALTHGTDLRRSPLVSENPLGLKKEGKEEVVGVVVML